VCGLLFFATTINYMDRQILSLLKPILDNQMGWTNEQFGAINSAFQGAYAVGGLVFGWLVDRIGSRVGYSISITGWSLAAIGHALVSTIGAFSWLAFAWGLLRQVISRPQLKPLRCICDLRFCLSGGIRAQSPVRTQVPASCFGAAKCMIGFPRRAVDTEESLPKQQSAQCRSAHNISRPLGHRILGSLRRLTRSCGERIVC
jgi:Major Facilitator Superfamily